MASNAWQENHLTPSWDEHLRREKGGVAAEMPFMLFPWQIMPDAKLMTFTSRLSMELFRETTCSDYEPLSNVKYISGHLAESVSIADMPIRFLEEVLFPLDTTDEAQILEFVRRWGVAYAPYFDSKTRFLASRAFREHGIRKGFDPLRRKAKKADAELAEHLWDGWADIEAWRNRFDFMLDEDGYSKALEEGAKESEGIRRELSATGQLEKGLHLISLNEVALSLEYLRELSAVFLALDIANGSLGRALQIALNYGVVPNILNPHIFKYETAESVLSSSSEEMARYAKRFAATFGQGGVDKNGLMFLSSYLFDNGGMCCNRFFAFPKNADASWLRAQRENPAGIGEAIATQLLGIVSLDSEWRYCAHCGRPFKRHAKRGAVEADAKRPKKSPFCSPACQQSKRRADKKAAVEYVIHQIAENDYLMTGKDAERVKNILNDACELANEKWPALRDREKNPTITLEKARELLEDSRSRFLSK